jgi:hypothetical protein
MKGNTSIREKIICYFSEWVAFSATRSGCPIKSRNAVYPLFRNPEYDLVFAGNEISASAFNDWHQKSTIVISATEKIFSCWAGQQN